MSDAASHAPVPPTPPPPVVARPWVRRHGEVLLWTALIGVLVVMQWPMLKGYYFKLTGAVAPAGTIVWHSDLSAALADSERLGRPVLLDAGASWCPPCITMKHDVWPDAEVARLVGAGYVALRVDVDQSPAVATRYNVATIPTVMVLDSDGSVLRTAGYLPRSGMVRFLTDATWPD